MNFAQARHHRATGPAEINASGVWRAPTVPDLKTGDQRHALRRCASIDRRAPNVLKRSERRGAMHPPPV
jgi:hypothetical protein